MKHKGKAVWRKIVLLLIMILISSVALAPFWFMVNMGTYKANELYTGIKLIPSNYIIENFKSLMAIDFFKYYVNSLIVAISSSALTVFVCSLCGYALSKYEFKGRKALINVVMLTMMVPTQLSLVGFAIEMNKIGWLNTLLPLIIPPAASPFGVFWIRQFTKDSIPDSVLESARLDGCSEFAIFLKIAFPFMRPACMTLMMLSFLWSWNSFIVPMIVLTDQKLYTITLGIRQLATQFRTDLGAQILGLTLATIPILILFSIFSKNLISGLASAAVKE
jgi:ABC-type sugar transport system, permease component